MRLSHWLICISHTLSISLAAAAARRNEHIISTSTTFSSRYHQQHPRNTPATIAINNIHDSKLHPQLLRAYALGVRGGAVKKVGTAAQTPPSSIICDSNPILLAKLLFTTTLEACLMYGVISTGQKLSSSDVGVPALLLPAALFAVVFGSSVFGAVIDGGLSAATNQVLKPNVVPGEPNWYANLNRPWWEPPGWVFPIMWLIVSKPTQLAALYVLTKPDAATSAATPYSREVALAAYCFHLALGDAWNKVFFGMQCVGLGVVVITTFFGVLVTSAVLFGGLDGVAGRFMIPTCAWVFVATCLNWSIYFRNM